MNSDAAPIEGQQITITLPNNLVQRLDQYVHPEQLSRFITGAIEQRLSFEEQFNALEETTSAWFRSEEDGDSLPEDEMAVWLREAERVHNQLKQ